MTADENLRPCPICQKQTDLLHASKCFACNMREQEEEDKKRWEGESDAAAKARREAEEFEAQQAAWREQLKLKRRL
jgi:hypothetical protein